MSRHLKTEAIVLKKKPLLNKDSLIFLFTQLQGKVVASAKGVKKITSRRSPHLETGNLINVFLSKKNDRYYLQETQLISGFSDLKKHTEKVKALYQYFFVLEKLLPENQSETVVYNLTKSFIIRLSQKVSEDTILTLFLNKLMRTLGYTKTDLGYVELEAVITDLINEKLPSFSI